MYKLVRFSGSTEASTLVVQVPSAAEMLVYLNKHRQTLNLVHGQLKIVDLNNQEHSVLTDTYSKVGIDFGMDDAKLRFLSMLDEVDHLYLRPDGVVLQPWQVLPEHWEAFCAIGSAVYNVFPCFTTEQRNARLDFLDRDGVSVSNTLCYLMSAEMHRRFAYGHNGPLYGPDRQSNSRHEVHVACALAEGKPVPEAVIEWHKAHPEPGRYDIERWFWVLLNEPAYRGRISAEKLARLVSVLSGEKPPIKLTAENADFFIKLVEPLAEGISYEGMDDFLFQNGVVKSLDAGPEPSPVDLTQAFSPFAVMLREQIAAEQMRLHTKAAHENREKYGHSLRLTERELVLAKRVPSSMPLGWANRMAEAIEQRNIDYMLETLDTPDDWNRITKKLFCQVFDVKLLGVKAEERRAAIFKWCGLNDIERHLYEKTQETQHAAKKQAEAVESAKNRAKEAKWRMANGEVVSGTEYVDRSVGEGYTELIVRMRGRVPQYWLSNPQTRCIRNILAKDGTLDYVRLVHGIKEQASPKAA